MQRLVESVSVVNGAGQRLLDAKLQEVGEQLGRLEARLREVERSLAVFVRRCENLRNAGKVAGPGTILMRSAVMTASGRSLG
jgi:hypothetical protein